VLERRDFTDPRWPVTDRSTLRYLTDALADRAGDPAPNWRAVRAVDPDP
jgi:hypothetical protein